MITTRKRRVVAIQSLRFQFDEKRIRVDGALNFRFIQIFYLKRMHFSIVISLKHTLPYAFSLTKDIRSDIKQLLRIRFLLGSKIGSVSTVKTTFRHTDP